MNILRAVTKVIFTLALLMPHTVTAQSNSETLADIRQELNYLFTDISQLKRELSTTGESGVTSRSGETVIQRLDSLEGELRRLTGQVEQLQFRVEKIVTDGTNRIGDLEFRLVELEGGDVSTLAETTTLGGIKTNRPDPVLLIQPLETTELAVSEQLDYERALAAFEAGEFQSSVDQFAVFTETYPGGPLTGDAHFWRGQAFAGLEDWNNAARSFLQSFSSAPEAVIAPKALLRLGISLDRIGQTEEACLTLNEVVVRYPGSEAEQSALAEMSALSCN